MQSRPTSEFKPRNVVITGGANGIGAAMVRVFHRAGARIFFCDTDAANGKALADQLGERVFFAKVDLLKERQVQRWIRSIGDRAQNIHVLVNNAAADPRASLEDMSVGDWDRLFARNLRAYFLTCREAAPLMPAGGSIINFASITFHTGPARMSAYVATKGGILGFTRSLARELGPRRIRVNTISPGWIMTSRQLREYVDAAARKLI
ncbi:MAG TPA: SDR family oxidoreductase, partial [Verrucomicrobiae bacterium]|nr:SDR family oxidoreductase [Verrucomicrobiae bacterium]